MIRRPVRTEYQIDRTTATSPTPPATPALNSSFIAKARPRAAAFTAAWLQSSMYRETTGSIVRRQESRVMLQPPWDAPPASTESSAATSPVYRASWSKASNPARESAGSAGT